MGNHLFSNANVLRYNNELGSKVYDNSDKPNRFKRDIFVRFKMYIHDRQFVREYLIDNLFANIVNSQVPEAVACHTFAWSCVMYMATLVVPCDIPLNSSPPSAAYICVSKSGQYWFWYWRVAYSVPSHYLNQCLIIVIRTLRSKWRPFCQGGDDLKRTWP